MSAGGAPTGRPAPVSVLMVCLGNICRSPTAEAVLRAKVEAGDLAGRVQVDSAGTGDWHVGHPPDARSQRHARRRGYDLSALRARQVEPADFERFDLVLAMDWDNWHELARRCPPQQAHKLRRLMEFAPQAGSDAVPDPYTGGAAGFETVLDLVETACDGLMQALRKPLLPLGNFAGRFRPEQWASPIIEQISRD